MPHRYLPLDVIQAYEPLMRARGVSEVARGPRGFLTAYKRAGGDPDRLSDAWDTKREGFIKRHLAQAKKEPMWENGEPTRRHLALIAWAYSPQASKIMKRSNPDLNMRRWAEMLERNSRFLDPENEWDRRTLRRRVYEDTRDLPFADLRELALAYGVQRPGRGRIRVAHALADAYLDRAVGGYLEPRGNPSGPAGRGECPSCDDYGSLYHGEGGFIGCRRCWTKWHEEPQYEGYDNEERSFRGRTERNPVRGWRNNWWRGDLPKREKLCYRTKTDALKVFKLWNQWLIDELDLEQPDPANYDIFDNPRVDTINKAMWIALPAREGPPWCLEAINLDLLNATDAIVRANDHRVFTLPDYVEELRLIEQADLEAEALYLDSDTGDYVPF